MTSIVSRMVRTGNYGGFLGFGSTGILAMAGAEKAEDPTGISYASALYSVADDEELRRYALLRSRAFHKLRQHMRSLWHLRFDQSLTAAQFEIIASISLWMASRTEGGERRHFRQCAMMFATEGLERAKAGAAPHTLAFLEINLARLDFEANRGQPALHRLRRVDALARDIAGADDLSRCYRRLALAYYSVDDHAHAVRYMHNADDVAGISETVQRKNRAAHKRMGL